MCVSATGKQHIWLFGKMQQWVLDRLRSHVDVNSAWGKPILLSLWLPTGEAMVEDLKERSLLLAGCCCLRLTCYILVSLRKKRACGYLWLTCWVVESDSPTCLQQQMQYEGAGRERARARLSLSLCRWCYDQRDILTSTSRERERETRLRPQATTSDD